MISPCKVGFSSGQTIWFGVKINGYFLCHFVYWSR
jgi:hypothetical protein